MTALANVTEVAIGDDPLAWRDAGFTVAHGRCQLGTVQIALMGSTADRGYRHWTLAGQGDSKRVEHIDGMATHVANEPSPDGARQVVAHPNGARTIDHLVWLTPDGERTARAITSMTGAEVRRTRDASTPTRSLTQRFFRFGDVILEVVSTEPPGDGPVAFFGIAVTVDDLDATVAALGSRVSEIRPAVQPGRRVATLRTKAFDISVPILFISAAG